MSEVLVNDECRFGHGAGVALYLENVVRHWPAESPLRPRGFVTHCVLRKSGWPERPAPRRSGLRACPLRELAPPRGSRGGVPLFLRRPARALYGRMLALESRRRRYALAFEPNHLAVACARPVVTAIHDLSVIDHPEWHPADRVRRWERALDLSIAVTTRFITDSEFTRDRMSARLGIAAERIEVIPLAPRPLPYPGAALVAERLRAAGLPARYLLHLGTVEPRKNIPLLLDAWAELPAVLRARASLLLAGAPGWGGAVFWRQLREHPAAAQVLATGYVSDPDAALLLAGAQALLVPSRYEGFGLPILEAMQCGSPVVCSDIPVFREVGAEAAAFVPAGDPDAWRRALERAVGDETWRARAAAAGREQAARFRWLETARRHARLMEEVAASVSR